MKKHLSFMMLLVALVVPWTSKAQDLVDYDFSTGTDASRWITLSNSATSIWTTYQDDVASSLYNIGFSFPFGMATYTQFSVNSNGNFRLGSTVIASSYYSTPFSSTNVTQNTPKIVGIGRDLGTGSNGYVKYQLTGTAPERVLVCEFAMGYTYGDSYTGDVKWQVQLHENGDVVLVYGSTPSTLPSSFQIGMSIDANDAFTINPSTHTMTTGATSTTYSVWPGANRYYKFTRPSLTCPKPASASVESLLPDEASFSWVESGTATSWIASLYYADSLIDEVVATDTFYTFYSLQPNTPYMFSVRALCGSDDTSSARSVAIRTACVPINSSSIPYTEDFESYGSGTTIFPTCWSKMGSTADRPYINATTTYGHNNSHGLYFYAVASGYCYAVMPMVDPTVPINTLQVSFWARQYSTSYNCDFEVGVMTNPSDTSTFTVIDRVHPAGTDYEMFDVPLSGYTGTGQYIAFRAVLHPGTSTAIYMMLDDVTLGPLPTCPHPTGLTVDSVGIDYATVHWTSAGSESSWLVYINGNNVDVAYDTTYTFTNLTDNTGYTFGVAAYCGVDDTSVVVTTNARTLCGAISQLPYSNDFESDPHYSTVAYASAFPNCWTRINDATSTYNYYPYLYASSSYAHSGATGMYWYHSTTTTYADNEYAVLPPVDLNVYDISDLTLAFYCKTTSTSYHPQPIVGVMTNPTDASTFTPVYTFTATEITTTWELFTISLSSYTGSGAYIAIKWPRPTSASYMAIDDIFLTDEWCNAPTNVIASSTPESITVSWNSNGGSSFSVVLGNDTISNVTDNSYTFSGLTANTPYNYAVITECSSSNSLPVTGSIYTACSYLDSLPYVQDFEAAATGSSTGATFVNCMTRLNNGTTNFGYPYVGGSSYNHTSGGAKGLYWYNTTTTGTYGDYQIISLPPVDTNLYPINTLQVKFWSRPSSTSYNPQFLVGVMSNPNDPNSFQLVQTVSVQATTTWQEFTVRLGAYTGNGQYIAIRANRPSSSWYAYLDDITLEQMPTCPPIVSHSVEATASAARIAWSYDLSFGAAPAGYDVSYGYASDPTSMTSVTTTDPVLVLTGLDADTSYAVSISPICGSDEGQAHTFIFNTQTLPCLEWDTSGYGGPTDTLGVSTPGTSTTNVMPVNNGYNYSYCQHLILASEFTHTGPLTISGIGFDYAYSSPMTHANNCQIYMGNTTRANFTVASGSSTDSMFVPYSQLTLVYQGPLNCTTNGYNYFQFNQGAFAYDGTSNIVVAIVNNSGATNSSAVFRYQQTGAPMTHRVYNNNTPYGPADMDAARAGQSFWRTNMKLVTGGGECIALASCAAPGVSVEQNADGDIQVDWIPGYQETSWDLDYKAGESGSWVNVLTGTSLTSYTFSLSDLQSNTNYTFRVSPNCTDTVISGIATFKTPCGFFTVPFSESFDTWSSTAADPLPSCWDKHTNYTTNYPYASTSYHHTGSKAMYMYSTNTTYSYMVLPQFNIPVDSTMISFWLYKSNTSYTHALSVGVMTDPENLSTFVEVAQVAPSTVSTWEPFEISLSSYTGTGRYIAILSPDGVYSYPYLDDLLVDRISSCPRVENVTASNIMQTSVTISWDTTSASSYVVEYGAGGFTPGAGTVVNVSGVDSVNITGLTAGTQYDVYVRALCGSDTSAWSFNETFFTACDAFPVPYFEGFESYGSGSTQSINPCWTKGSNSGTAYPYPYSTNAVTGSRSLYFYAYHPSSTSTTAIYSYAALPQFQEPITNLGMDFKVRTYSSSGNYYTTYLLVGVMTNPNDINTFTAVDTIDLFGAATSSVHEVSVSFANYTGTGLHIAIYDPVSPVFGTSSYNYSYAYVDDIFVDVLPECPRVEHLMATTVLLDSAIITWTDTSDNSGWNVEYDVTPFTPGTGHMTPIHVTDTSCLLTGLDSGTYYYVYVYPDCDSNVYYRQTGFTTLASSPASVPFSCNFEGSGNNGWDLLITGQANHWMVGSATSNGGTRSLYVTNDGTTNSYTNSSISYSYAIRVLRLSDAGEYAYSYDWKGQGESHYYDFTRVFLVPAAEQFTAGQVLGGSTYNFASAACPATWYELTQSGASPNTLAMSTSWQTVTGTVYVSIPGSYKLVFAWANDGSGGSNPPTAIDNVSLTRNTCPSVLNITATNVTSSGATITWTAAGSESQWIVTVGNNTMVTNTPSITVSGLTAMTAYTVRVRPVCSASDTGMAASILLTTEMCDNPDIVATGDPTTSTTTTYYTPLNNFYNYTLTETIIDSAELDGPMEITAVAYYYDYSSASSVKNDVDIYIQPTNKSVFASSSDIVPLSTDAVLVYSGPLNCIQGWNTFGFTTPYSYSGTGNLMVIVDDNSGDYDGSSYVFKSQSTTGYKTIVYYSDTYDPDVTSISSSYSGSKNYYQYRAVMELISCGAGCPSPVVSSTTVSYDNATINVTGSGFAYELTYGTDPSNLGNLISSTSGLFELNGLSAETQYFYSIVQLCDSGAVSQPTTGVFVTDSLPCFDPTNLTLQGTTFNSAELRWTSHGSATSWVVSLTGAGETRYDTVTTNPYTARGLYSDQQYVAMVMSICGNGAAESGWSDPLTFTTDVCTPVSNVTVNDITATSARVSWDPVANTMGYKVYYGDPEFYDNEAHTAEVAAGTTTYTITGLNPETPYEVYVRNRCSETLYSPVTNQDRIGFTTGSETEGIYDVENGTLTLFPNPASEKVTITVTGIDGMVEVEIVDMNGRVAGNWQLTAGNLTLDVSDLAQGAYFVRVTGESQTAVRKLIVK